MIYFEYFSFSTIHLELKKQMRLYAPVVLLKTRFKTIIPVFTPKRLKNHTLWGSTYLYSLYRGVPPPPSGGGGRLRLETSALEPLYNSQITLSTLLIKSNTHFCFLTSKKSMHFPLPPPILRSTYIAVFKYRRGNNEA